MTLDGIWDDIERVGRDLGEPERGAGLAIQLRRRVGAIVGEIESSPSRPSVVCLEWLNPLMGAGSWIPEMVAAAGGVNLLGLPGGHAPTLTMADLCAADPDIIIVAPCGFALDRSVLELELLAHDAFWRSLRAVRHGRVFAVDGNSYFNRPGPRIADSVEVIAEMIHPDRFSYGLEGRAWRRVNSLVDSNP
jgi:iron complex transport system substrate-binding protein